ncbi:Response regulator receiver domain-containing protein [Palleronia marisminoris]|uniref:Two-component response regulator n=1 Tax=Palleronia marisminoris TaxID=315423 RepID=A0A1Y5THP5_9RHOB|nr:response regulator [Palleronia marisminoris]SFH36822.1 Response regulator receiver domain-containing protein [Palleronia marisminoris]SLN62290.1 two-component response regulator [Palleronia marisminoris]
MDETTVAIVEDEVLIALDLQFPCEEAGCCVLGIATTAAGAQQKFSDVLPDVRITDMDLADSSDGVEVVEHMRILRPDVAFIFVTATTALGKLHRIAAARPDRVLKKPLRVEDLFDELL